MMMVMGWMDCEEEEESFVGRVGWERINHAGEKRRLSGLRSRGQVSRSEEERRLPGWFWQRRYLNWPNCSSRMAAADCLNRTIILIFCPQFVASELPSSQARAYCFSFQVVFSRTLFAAAKEIPVGASEALKP